MINEIHHGDNLAVLKQLQPIYKNKIDLIYIDPPYMTGRKFAISDTRSTANTTNISDIAYSDMLSGAAFINMLKERIELAHELLSNAGSFYLHMDSKVAYDVKPMLDNIFGQDNFKRPIARIKTASKNFPQRNYGSIYDTILFYVKSDQFIWNEPRLIFPPEREAEFDQMDERGKYRSNPLHAPGVTKKGETGSPFRGIMPPAGRHWKTRFDNLEKMDKDGLIDWNGKIPREKYYLQTAMRNGVRADDLWTGFRDPAKSSYPTEKNLSMLDLIVKTSSNPYSIVLDFFCGSGSTLEAAAKAGRHFIGIDKGEQSIKLCKKRVANYMGELF